MFVPNVHCKLTVTDQSWSEKAKFCGEIMFSNVYQEDDPHSFLDCISWRFILLYSESHDYCFVYIIYTLFFGIILFHVFHSPHMLILKWTLEKYSD